MEKINFHHLNRYNFIINHYKNNPKQGFCELHHIIPKCLGGTNETENLILVPSRAHFILHALLHKSYPENKKIAHAFSMMTVNNKHQKRNFSSRLYELSKKARSEALTGVSRPEWVREKLRKPKSTTINYKKPKTKEHSRNISKALTGKKKTKDHIQNLKISCREYQEKRKCQTREKIDYYRKLFQESGLSRKQFLSLHGINYSTGKKYLTGL
jgi:hypothetical protein